SSAKTVSRYRGLAGALLSGSGSCTCAVPSGQRRPSRALAVRERRYWSSSDVSGDQDENAGASCSLGGRQGHSGKTGRGHLKGKRLYQSRLSYLYLRCLVDRGSKYRRKPIMKLVTVFLLVTLSICSYSATAFLANSLPEAVNNALPLPVDNLLPFLDPLKLLLKTLGISVEHLVEGLKKCVNELGPGASEAVKKLLEALSHLV
uniref:Secretoglobin family 3A member 2 n=2 Tax=Felis catus TaxID=9685 RepID=A0ABI7Z7V0_FELCA